jgi:hypothetical protein
MLKRGKQHCSLAHNYTLCYVMVSTLNVVATSEVSYHHTSLHSECKLHGLAALCL